MDKKKIYGTIFAIGLLYPIISLFSLSNAFSTAEELAVVGQSLRNYLASIWILWVVMIVLAVHHKWTSGKNFLFFIIYGIVLIGFLIYGYYAQRMVSVFDLPSTFEDSYSFGVFASLQQLFTAGVLTGLLQVGVWWFTRRWHRR